MNHYGLWMDASLPGLSIVVLGRASAGSWSVMSEYHDNTLGASNQINSILNSMLNKLGVKPAQIEYLAVGTGPGSFTGIKVAMAWAYGFFCIESSMFVAGFSALWLGSLGVKKEKSQVLLKVTSSHGFWAKMSLQGYSEFPFERSEFKTILEDGDIYLASYWPEMESDLNQAGVPYVPLESLRNHALIGLLATLNQPGFEWKTEFPSPRYLKLSTAEEKLIKNQESFLG